MNVMTPDNIIKLMQDAYDVAVKAALPDDTMAKYLPDPQKDGKTYVIAIGKAAAKMAQVFEDMWPNENYEGLAVTRYGHELPTQKIKVMTAAHPVPDENGVKAAQAIMDFVAQARANDSIILLLSGGGSALITCPEDGIAFADVQNLNKQLLSCGASITEINCIRKHLNMAFGGKLALQAAPAKIVTLAISDVAGDNPSVIASGPTVPDETTLGDALDIIKKYGLDVPVSIKAFLGNPANETPKTPDFESLDHTYHLIATPMNSLQAAEEFLQSRGFKTHILSDAIEGDTNQTAADICRNILERMDQFPRPLAILSGGETTVTVQNPSGRGGPNTQFMLASALYLDGHFNVYGLAADTDGVDGNVENAGAYITPETLQIAHDKGLDALSYLKNTDSYSFFDAIGHCITPGPTHTNVNDFRVFLII